jgi:hypothetical protein
MIRWAGIVLAAMLVGTALAGIGNGVVLYVYVFCVGGAMLVVLVARIGAGTGRTRALRATRDVEPADEPVAELEQIVLRIASAEWNEFGLNTRLRPVVVQIVRTQLAYGHGVDLDRQPERAEALLEERTWQLVRPDPNRRSSTAAPGWALGELEELVSELERL